MAVIETTDISTVIVSTTTSILLQIKIKINNKNNVVLAKKLTI